MDYDGWKPGCGEPLSLIELQEQVIKWTKHNFGGHGPVFPLMMAVTEMGELAHAQGRLAASVGDAIAERIKAQEAVARVTIQLADYCARMGFGYQGTLENVWGRMRQHDYKLNPGTGVPATEREV